MAITVTFLPDSELRTPLIRAIRRAKTSVDMVYFYWKTRYPGVRPINEIVNAVKQAAKKEDVRVVVLLGYGSDVPSIQYLNYLTGQMLAAAGVEVRLAPTNRTTHAKITVVDGEHTFIGSHNVTRGAGGSSPTRSYLSLSDDWSFRGKKVINAPLDPSKSTSRKSLLASLPVVMV